MIGHKDRLINGKPIAEYIRDSVAHECAYYGVPQPTLEQIAIVASQLRMHTIMAHAVSYDQSELGQPGQRTTFYPEASSVGRFLRDSSQITLDNINRDISQK